MSMAHVRFIFLACLALSSGVEKTCHANGNSTAAAVSSDAGVMGYVVQFTGIVASAIGVISSAPQIYEVFKKKEAEQLTWGWLVLNEVSNALWTAYGVMINDPIITASSAISTACGATLIVGKCIYGHAPAPANGTRQQGTVPVQPVREHHIPIGAAVAAH